MSTDFRRQLNLAYENKVEKKLDKVVRGTALIIFGEIVKNTPVDTGRARGNWNIDINVVDVSTDNPEIPGEKGDRAGDDYADRKADATLARYKISDTVFISNNLPYIRRLNEGHSTQSPAGFVEGAIQIGKRKGKELAKQ